MDRWHRVFDTIELCTEQSDTCPLDNDVKHVLQHQSRVEMADMYQAMKDKGFLRLFGAISKENMPASGSHKVEPSIVEEVTRLSMKNLSSIQKKPFTLLTHPVVHLVLLEVFASVVFGLDLMLLLSLTLSVALADNFFLKGAILESIVKTLAPNTQSKITWHEAGHFLTAYLLGCPVEGCVLSAWQALRDVRFKSRSITAGTSFFDPNPCFQQEMPKNGASAKIEDSFLDRYSIIIMAGIAAEALHFGKTEGGSTDEIMLTKMLRKQTHWDDDTIQNQVRWGILQATLILQQYQECFSALVEELERGGSIGTVVLTVHGEDVGGEAAEGRPAR